ncbi:MAG TPA: terpene synthase family protein, partial [Archangium sp.]|nr:terpene synthase family protein [Archangium sp.]
MTANTVLNHNHECEAEKNPKHLRVAPQDSRYAHVDALIGKLRGRDRVAFDLQVDGLRHRVEWPLDFSEYRVIASTSPVSLHLSSRGHFPELEMLRSHLLHSDLDLLTYYTCSTSSARYLQNSQDRMDWFFALDYFVDGPEMPLELRQEVVRELTTWLEDRRHRSRLPWVNSLNAMLRVVLEDMEHDGLDTSLVVQATRRYFEGFLLEFDKTVPLERYLENRSRTIGMGPEVESCFAYLGRRLPLQERGPAERIKELAAHLVALQNDALSLRKEEDQEQGHLHLKTYFPDSREYVSFLRGFYQARYADFLAQRPRSPGPLEDLWWVCYQWICGSLVWHLTSRRY